MRKKEEEENDDNEWKRERNNNSYITLHPVQMHELAALYIMNIKIHLAIKKVQVL